MITPRELARMLEGVPTTRLGVIDLWNAHAGPDGRIPPEVMQAKAPDWNTAVAQARAYVSGTMSLRDAVLKLPPVAAPW